MRQKEKIDELERELRRWKKKVEDQKKEVTELRKDLQLADKAAGQVSRIVDALLAQVALTYGEHIPDDDGVTEAGIRLTVPVYRIDDVLSQYGVHARRDDVAGAYIIGVVAKDDGKEEGERDGSEHE